MFYHSINPVLFSIAGFEIRWYSLMYIFGIIISYLFVLWHVKAKKLKVKRDQINDVFFYLIMGLLVGGRLFYCLIYNPAYYFTHLLDIFKIWQGGMSFHGGFVTALFFGWLYCRKHKLKFLKLADVIILPLPIALALGRLGNFINGELWGRPTSLPFGFSFPHAPDRGAIARHPSQIYEAIKNLLIFFGLLVLDRKQHKDGQILFGFMLFYGILRILVELVREPEIILFGVTMGQWLSIPLVIAGAYGLLKKN